MLSTRFESQHLTMTSHRQSRTPLYGGLPFWWGDDDVIRSDLLTNNLKMSRVEPKLTSDQSPCTSAQKTIVDVEQRHDEVLDSSTPRLPAVSFTVSLDGSPIDLTSSLSQYFPANKQRRRNQNCRDDDSPPCRYHRCPVTSREHRHGNDDDAVSEAGTYVVETPMNAVRLQRQRIRPARSFSSLSIGPQISTLTSAMTQSRFSRRVLRRSLPRLPCDDDQNEARACYNRRWQRDVTSSNSTAQRRPDNNDNNRNITSTTTGSNGFPPSANSSEKKPLKKSHESSTSTEMMNRKNIGGGSSTWRSVDTNLLLQNVDKLETTRTALSVDTDVLLADLDPDDTPSRSRHFISADSVSPEQSPGDFRHSDDTDDFESSRGLSMGDVVDRVSLSSSPPRSALTSRTLASVDTNILLDSTEAVVAAMDLVRGRHTREGLEPSRSSVKANHEENSLSDNEESTGPLSVKRNSIRTTQDQDDDKIKASDKYIRVDAPEMRFPPSSNKPVNNSVNSFPGGRTSSTSMSSNEFNQRPLRQATATKSRSSCLRLAERDEQCLVNVSLVSSVRQLSSIVTSQADQLVTSLQRTLNLHVDSYGRPKSRVSRMNNGIEADMLDVLDNLEAAGHQLLAINKVLATLSATNNNGTQRRHHVT